MSFFEHKSAEDDEFEKASAEYFELMRQDKPKKLNRKQRRALAAAQREKERLEQESSTENKAEQGDSTQNNESNNPSPTTSPEGAVTKPEEPFASYGTEKLVTNTGETTPVAIEENDTETFDDNSEPVLSVPDSNADTTIASVEENEEYQELEDSTEENLNDGTVDNGEEFEYGSLDEALSEYNNTAFEDEFNYEDLAEAEEPEQKIEEQQIEQAEISDAVIPDSLMELVENYGQAAENDETISSSQSDDIELSEEQIREMEEAMYGDSDDIPVSSVDETSSSKEQYTEIENRKRILRLREEKRKANNIKHISALDIQNGGISQDDAESHLRDISVSEEVERVFFQALSPKVNGLRAIVIGNKGTKKEEFLDEYAAILYGLGKIDSQKPIRCTFGNTPKELKERELYCIDDLASAVNHLFNLEDFSDEASQQQHFYHDVLIRILMASSNCYIVLNCTREEIKGFMPLDARIPYIFDKKCEFPDLSNEEILFLMENSVPETHKEQFTEEFSARALGYIERNRRFFPFNNQELASYLVHYSTRQPELTLPKERYNPSSLDETFAKIVGMENVKAQVKELSEYLSVRNKLIDAGAHLPDFNLHMMFLGNPGVGKTSIARVIAKLLFDLGYLREEKIIEVTSKDLIGAYGNQTGLKTNRAIMSALGGVLFVDEAYSLSMNCGQAGAEAIAILIKAMMDYKDDLVVMFAGYTKEMRDFVDSNSGISSRISYIFRFEDYSPDELFSIFTIKLEDIGMKLADEAYDKVMQLLKQMSGRRNAGNGRLVDNLIQKSLTKHALLPLSGNDLLTLRPESIPDLSELMQTIYQ